MQLEIQNSLREFIHQEDEKWCGLTLRLYHIGSELTLTSDEIHQMANLRGLNPY